MAGELISWVVLTEFGKIIKYVYIYTHLDVRAVLLFAGHSADILIIFATSHCYNNSNEIILLKYPTKQNQLKLS